MTFIDWANNNTFLLVLILTVLLFIGIRLGYTRGGWNRNMVYLWTLMIFVPYLLLSPWYFYSVNRATIIGTDITNYYGIHFFFSCVAIMVFIIGYWVVSDKKNQWKKVEEKKFSNYGKYMPWIFYCTYGIVMLNMAVGGVDVTNVFLGDEVVGLGARGASYFLQNFADSLICILVLAFLLDVPKLQWLIWIFLSFFLFFLLGFRYRIILSLSGLVLVYIFKNRISTKQIVVGTIMAAIFLYFTIFSTINRQKLISKNYEAIEYNPLKFKMEGFYEQTRGALADMALYKVYDNPNKEVSHDWGLTMFGYVFIRMIPRSIYPDKDKFYPPPQQVIQGQAYEAYWAAKSGEACLSSGALYVAWGWMGIVLGHFFWGVLLKKLANNISKNDPLDIAMYIVFALATFQWITRGYFPQAIDHFVYMMAPIWVLRYIRKRSAHAHN
jgi:hypothetical protein